MKIDKKKNNNPEKVRSLRNRISVISNRAWEEVRLDTDFKGGLMNLLLSLVSLSNLTNSLTKLKCYQNDAERIFKKLKQTDKND